MIKELKIFIAVAESTVPMKESVEDATAKGDGSSVILNKNTEEGNDNDISFCPEKEIDVKLGNSQEIISSQFNDKRVEKGKITPKHQNKFSPNVYVYLLLKGRQVHFCKSH